MADTITIKDDGKTFESHPEGQYGAVCVDVVDLGQRLKNYPGTPPKLQPTLAIVFHTDERDANGQPIELSAEFSASMNSKAALRGFLESWRGKSYTEEQAKAGIPVHKLEGIGALVSVEHKTSQKGRTYAKIKSIAPLPKAMTAPGRDGYRRAEYWAERKDSYAKEAAQFLRDHGNQNHDDFPPPVDSDDDMPF